MSRNKLILFFLSIFFVLLSLVPSFYELSLVNKIPSERYFLLEHNYLFDFNFYLSRIRQGMEGRWTVTEKYYNKPHKSSLFQIGYLYLGKIGGIFRLGPNAIYHISRVIIGFSFLLLIAFYATKFFNSWWQIIAFLLVGTSGSWPILVNTGTTWRFATYMGWWSVIDSLQRITFIPHILVGQMFILYFIMHFFSSKTSQKVHWMINGLLGWVAGIIFPPTLITVYVTIFILTFLELVFVHTKKGLMLMTIVKWFKDEVLPRIFFIILSIPSLFYLRFGSKELPWSSLALFDIQHRIPLPYGEYARALGSLLPIGIISALLVLMARRKKFFPWVAWIIAVFVLFVIFEKVPEQSPLRFTESAIHIPLGFLATYLFYILWTGTNQLRRLSKLAIRGVLGIVVTAIILMGLGVMGSMILWLSDQAYAKGKGSWKVPIGAQLVYPLDDFMKAIYYFAENTKKEETVLSYVTAGNYIPAYAGNYVYIGHANTPDEDVKEKMAAYFYSGRMKPDEASEFLRKENIAYIFWGPQEKELGTMTDFGSNYDFLKTFYSNPSVTIYKVASSLL